jgi:hypothetical protein
MKTIKVTYIDTAGHGYYSVSKDDIRLVGLDPKEISGYSGMTLNRVYLEEDCDAGKFIDLAKAKGHEVVFKSSYNERFKFKHSYVADLFDYVPVEGQEVILSDKEHYLITEVRPNGTIYVRSLLSRMIYRISPSNPFEHIRGIAQKATA